MPCRGALFKIDIAEQRPRRPVYPAHRHPRRRSAKGESCSRNRVETRVFQQPAKFRSVTTDYDGLTAFKIEKTGTEVVEFSHIIAPSFEFQHVPENGSLIQCEAKGFIIDGIQLFDVECDNTFTNACAIRLIGGNGSEVRGTLPGNGGTAKSLPYGVIVEGSRNRIVGRRGFDKNNVLLKSGTQYNYIEVGGQDAGTDAQSSAAVVNNSGNSDNVILDHTTRTWDVAGKLKLFGNGTFRQRFELLEGMRLYARAASEAALIAYGAAGHTGRVVQVFNEPGGATLLAIDSGGEIWTNQADSGFSTLGTVVGRKAEYNENGVFIGYAPALRRDHLIRRAFNARDRA